MNTHAHTHSWLILCPLLTVLTIMPSQIFATPTCINKELRIAIDIGHSPAQPGVISARGVTEYSFNLNLAHRLLSRLLKQGFSQTFIITSTNPEMPLHARASFANARRADLLIAIHHDSVQPHYLSVWEFEGEQQRYSDRFQGYSLFISEHNGDYTGSLTFAHLLGDELNSLELKPTLHHAESIAGENRLLLEAEKGIYRFDELLILKNSKMPAVLMECGVLVNRQEEKLLASSSYQQTLIAAIERAVLRFAQVPAAAQ